MPNIIKILRSSVAKARPAGRAAGELYVNFADRVMGYINATGQPVDLQIGAHVGDTPPVDPILGRIWYKTSLPVGVYAWVYDGNSTQWVHIAGFLRPPLADADESKAGTLIDKLISPLTLRVVLDAEKQEVDMALRGKAVNTAIFPVHPHAEEMIFTFSRVDLANADTLSMGIDPVPVLVPSAFNPRVGFEVSKMDVVGGAATTTPPVVTTDLLLCTAGAAGKVSGSVRIKRVASRLWTLDGDVFGPGGRYTRLTGHYENNAEVITQVKLLSSRTTFSNTYGQEASLKSER